MSKNWQVLPKITQEFKRSLPQYDEVVLQLLHNRGLIEPNEIETFLNPDYAKYSFDPFLFKHMDEAAELVIKHIKAGNKIIVYGDYDADGVTSSATLTDVLTTLKADVDVYIPYRVTEGYGLNVAAIKEFAATGAKLIITVDNGIRNKAEVEKIKSLGMEVVITDHHIAPPERDELPGCLIVNPILAGEKYPFKYLAGVGVASKLAIALIRKSKLSDDAKLKLEESILDLVAIGTVADCVTLLDENRVLAKKGLEVLNKTKRLGLKELINVSKINNGKQLDSWNISFQLSPRLNAAGRMDHANAAYKLLVTKDGAEAVRLAASLNEHNLDRQKTTEEIVDQIVKKVEASPIKDKIIIAVSPSVYGEGEAWNEGVIGLVAGKITEKYYLPTLVITGSVEEMKGSGRSIEEFNLMEAVEAKGDSLLKYGGHAAACGFSIKGKDNLDKFIQDITGYANDRLKRFKLAPKLTIEADLDLVKVDEILLEQLERFAPFGEDNSRPVFLSQDVVIVDILTMGIDGRHLKLKVKNLRSKVFSALAFGQAEEWKDLRVGDKIDLAYYAEFNEFNGRRDVQLRVADIKLHQAN